MNVSRNHLTRTHTRNDQCLTLHKYAEQMCRQKNNNIIRIINIWFMLNASNEFWQCNNCSSSKQFDRINLPIPPICWPQLNAANMQHTNTHANFYIIHMCMCTHKNALWLRESEIRLMVMADHTHTIWHSIPVLHSARLHARECIMMTIIYSFSCLFSFIYCYNVEFHHVPYAQWMCTLFPLSLVQLHYANS